MLPMTNLKTKINNKKRHHDNNHLKTGAWTIPITLCISNIPQVMDNIQHNIDIMNQPVTNLYRTVSDFKLITVNPHVYYTDFL